MTERKWPTEDDLLAGRMPDGSRPPLHSKDLPEFDPLYLHSLRVKNEGVPELPPAIHGKDPADMTEEELHMLVDHRCLQQMDRALDFAMDMIDVGREGLALARRDTAVPPSPRLRRAGPSAPGAGGCSAPIGVADPATRGSAGDVQTDDSADSCEERSPSSGSDETSVSHAGVPADPYRDAYRMSSPRTEKSEKRVVTPPAPHEPDDDERERIERDTDARRAKQDVLRGVGGNSDTAVPAVGGAAPGAAREAGELTGDVRTSDNADSCKECSPSSRADATSAPARRSLGEGGTPVSRRMSAAQMIAVGERGSKLVFKIAPARAKLAHELVKRAKAADLKEEFYENRAVAVVKHTLCHLDDAFQDLGFGGWMPFRTVDQWLMFCGFMQRILAANGLIHSEHADVYRRLLDETPTPLPPGEQRTPQNWGQCFRNRTFHNMDYLKRNIAAKDAGRPPPHE